jgi:predicted nuclease of predicted toxin-antitoxin system
MPSRNVIHFVADESVDATIFAALRQEGYFVYSIQESQFGIIDEQVLDIANERKAVLLTEDKDFGELVYRLKLPHCGVFLMRLIGLTSEEKAVAALTTVKYYIQEMPYNFSVLKDGKVRIRKKSNKDPSV